MPVTESPRLARPPRRSPALEPKPYARIRTSGKPPATNSWFSVFPAHPCHHGNRHQAGSLERRRPAVFVALVPGDFQEVPPRLVEGPGGQQRSVDAPDADPRAVAHQHPQGLAEPDARLARVLPLPPGPLRPAGQRVDRDKFLDLAAAQHEPVL